MGQYYRAVVGKKNVCALKNCKIFDSFDVKDVDGSDSGSGMKILEHGWMGNWFCLGVEKEIYKNPMRIIWVGDYADAEMRKAAKKAAKASFIPGPGVWAKDGTEVIVHDESFSLDGKFLVNHTLRQFVALDDYASRSKDEDAWSIDPLPLLTAIGNGQGGGDYYGAMSAGFVGAWAWHEISIEDAPPDGYVLIEPTFKESPRLGEDVMPYAPAEAVARRAFFEALAPDFSVGS